MIDEREYVAEKYADYDNLSESEQGEYQQKKSLYDSIFEQYIPGFSPLEQAVSIYLKLKSQTEKQDRARWKDDDDDVDLAKPLDFDRTIYSDPNNQ